MDEKMLWQRFCENGSVKDYLNYRSCVNSDEKTEMEELGENNSTGVGDTGTIDRRVR